MSTPVPSPLPPWHRDNYTGITETLDGDGEASIGCDTTYLSSIVPKDEDDSDVPYLVTLPDGTVQRQTKTIHVPAGNAATTAKFKVTGTFVGFSALLFSTIAWSAMLQWDGAGWHWIGGNAQQIDE